MQISDDIINFEYRILRLLAVPISTIIIFVLTINLWYRYPAKISLEPPFIEGLDLNPFFLFVVVFFYFFLIQFVPWSYFNRSQEKAKGRITINEEMICIETLGIELKFDLNQDVEFMIKESKIIGTFYPEYFKLFGIKIKYMGDKYFFVFPVRNMDDYENAKENRNNN